MGGEFTQGESILSRGTLGNAKINKLFVIFHVIVSKLYQKFGYFKLWGSY